MGDEDTSQSSSGNEQRRIAERLDAAGWALFFIWVGIALLADVGIGIGLIGVAVIIMGEQLVRKHFALKPEGFWLVVGLVFAVAGIWQLLGIQASLVPILLIVAGVVILITRVWSKGRSKRL